MQSRSWLYVMVATLCQFVLACTPAPERSRTPASLSATAAADGPLVVAFGDSLFAGYGLEPSQGFAPALERALAGQGVQARVINAGVSGDTTAAGLARLAFTLDGLPRKPDLVIVGLGANDMLRGLSPAETRTNLEAILAELDRREIPTALVTMTAAPNLGEDYARTFNPIYAELARLKGVRLYPFFLDGVASRPDRLLPDGMHPNARGIEDIAARFAPIVSRDLPPH
ncbi:arylesterase [Phenylobacterium sp.]|uniref:arylesterase n=1 Tax=Phenylobacterium sp. TaxID=1871053 RepID=UPI002600F61B|nr:arylesterase [Phenylobacterium sp.]MCA3719601.1 arylesterase [Phenylobacterium sp.]